MRVLVIGGEGFIGQALVARLCHGGTIDGRTASALTVLDQRIGSRLPDPRLQYLEGDIADPAVDRKSVV